MNYSRPITKYLKQEPEWDRIRKICGGWVRPITLADGRQMFVNEDGLLKGLRVNEEASRLAGTVIVGNAVVVGEVER